MSRTHLQPSPDGDVATAGGRFPCPSCGSMLRKGAILCPDCDADLWRLTRGEPEASHETAAAATPDVADEATSPDARVAGRSVAVGAAALGGRLVVSLAAAAAHGPSLVMSVLGWVAAVIGLYGVYLARRVLRGTADAHDSGASAMAGYGLVLGMAAVAYSVALLITSSLDQVIGVVQR